MVSLELQSDAPVLEMTLCTIRGLVDSIGLVFFFVNASGLLSSSVAQYCTESDNEWGIVLNANGTPELYLLLTSFVTQGADLSFLV